MKILIVLIEISLCLLITVGCTSPSGKSSASAVAAHDAKAMESGSSERAYVTIKTLTLGEGSASAEVGLSVSMPGNPPRDFPDAGKVWPIRPGQSLAIFQSMEVTGRDIHNDGFDFVIQMRHSSESFQPCHFHVEKLSAFSRTYICRTVERATRMAENSVPELAVQVSVADNPEDADVKTTKHLVRR